MTDRPAHVLLDAGDGRRLDRFGDRVVDRPSAVAYGPRDPAAGWDAADLRFERGEGWSVRGESPLEPWTISIDRLTLELRPAAGGQVGLFPEQAGIWSWLAAQVADRTPADRSAGGAVPRVLHLFAYTGAATLALAAGGAAVTHLDASRPAVAWARRNAALSGLSERPVRWLVDDAAAFVRREMRRAARYDGLVLDPPTFGHGRGGATWRLADDLPDLLATCALLLDPRAPFVALTAHTAELEPDRLGEVLATALGVAPAEVEVGQLDLEAATGAGLELGVSARWTG
jgi:23S rRNA (cytosine1962-C5)-methyltransferase